MNIDPPIERVRAALATQYDLSITGIPVEMNRGVHSRAWLVTSDRGKWVAKVHDPASDPEEKLVQQSALYEYLNSHGINAPAVLPTTDGRAVGRLPIDDQIVPLTVMRWNAMTRVVPSAVTQTEIAAAGQLAARLHQTLRLYPHLEHLKDDCKAAQEWGQQRDGMYRDLLASPNAALFSADELAWLEALDYALVRYITDNFPDPATLSLALLHGDLNFEHIQFLPNGEPYVFDFGDASWGPVAHELAQFLQNSDSDSDISFHHWEELRTWLIEAYATVSELLPHDVAAINLFVVNRIVAQASYICELAGEANQPLAAEDIKRTYQLAEYLVQK